MILLWCYYVLSQNVHRLPHIYILRSLLFCGFWFSGWMCVRCDSGSSNQSGCLMGGIWAFTQYKSTPIWIEPLITHFGLVSMQTVDRSSDPFDTHTYIHICLHTLNKKTFFNKRMYINPPQLYVYLHLIEKQCEPFARNIVQSAGIKISLCRKLWKDFSYYILSIIICVV